MAGIFYILLVSFCLHGRFSSDKYNYIFSHIASFLHGILQKFDVQYIAWRFRVAV